MFLSYCAFLGLPFIPFLLCCFVILLEVAPHFCFRFRPLPVVVVQDMFKKYIGFAKSIMRALPPEEIPSELSDTHLFGESCGIILGDEQRFDVEDIRHAAETVENGFESCTGMIKVRCVLACLSHCMAYGVKHR